MPSVIMPSVIMLSVFMLSVVMLSVVMLSVLAPSTNVCGQQSINLCVINRGVIFIVAIALLKENEISMFNN
jgi:hypothetical protein